VNEHGLDVFAGGQAIDPEIDACAREVALLDVTNLDVVGETALGLNAEIAKDRVIRRAVFDAGILVAGALAAALDLVLVRCAPVVGGRGGFGIHGKGSV